MYIASGFTQCPIFHQKISNRGCRDCVPGFVYIAYSGNVYKIGSTTQVSHECISTRLASLRRLTQIDFTFHHALYSNCAKGLEKVLHNTFAQQRVQIDLVTGHKALELFVLKSNDLENIMAIERFNGAPVAHIEDMKQVASHLVWSTL